ncbi:MAG: MotA/TolQ/ExbB proton channel family protein [Phycisphaeraceae bacterium]|nr:MotA/TolQ/ExbB proton channel family protein [Phycisphaeraceae bacterium]
MISLLLAQAAPATPASGTASGGTSSAVIDPITGALQSWGTLFQFSPIINGIIAGLSVLALLMFLYNLLSINSRAMVPADLVDELTKLVLARKYEQAADLCRANRRVFIASIVQRCAENAGQEHSVILDMLDAEGRRRADVVWNRISYLADVANVAPMLGLLGTVMGMIKAFFLLEGQTGSANATALASGVGQAMSTTMFGLIVAIGSLVFYSLIKSRATRVLAEAEQAVHSIADHLKRNSA